MREVALPFWVGLGLLVGSFANVLIARLPYGEGVTRGRSRCPHCGETIRAFPDLVPVLSWVLLRGRCRACAAPISARYPIVEILSGGLFLLAWRAGRSPAEIVWLGAWLWFLLVVAVIDLETRLILNVMTYPAAALAVAGRFLWFAPPNTIAENPLFGAWFAGGSLWLVGWIGGKVFRKEAMGMGDVKLMVVLGGLLGAAGSLEAFLLGSILGGLVSLILVLAGRVEMKGAVPYGPFLAAGGAWVLLMGRLWI